MSIQPSTGPTRVLGSPLPGDEPWTELPFPTYWVDHFPSASSAQPQFLAVVYDKKMHALWMDDDEQLDVALSKAFAAAKSEGGDSAVVYRYVNARGSAGADTALKYSYLVDGYYELSTPGIATWISAIEVAEDGRFTD